MNRLAENSRQAVLYMIRGITHVCRSMKSRAPGSEGERECGEYMAELIKRECGAREVLIEAFREHPTAFCCCFCLSAVLSCLCAAFFFILPWLGIVFGAAALLIFLLQFVLYKQVIDPLFPERESVNVTAVRPCRGEVRQRVFLSGHMDASWEFPLNYHLGGFAVGLSGVMAIIGVFFYIALSILALAGAGGCLQAAGFCGFTFIPFFVLAAFTYDPGRVVDGANDNLSACFTGIAVLAEMERLGVELEHTELGLILTGSEEAGLRGAKAWSRAHRNDYRDVPTYILCFDTIHDPEQLMVNMRDLNGTVASDRSLGEAFLETAQKAGVPCKKGKVPLFGGATDSAAFTQGGFRSVGITGLSHKLEDYYHTRRDTCDNLDETGLENCYRATVALIGSLEEQAKHNTSNKIQ